MSVTFTAHTRDGFTSKREPCLCAQMSLHFVAFFEGTRDDWEALREDANPDCQICGGSGVEERRVDLRPNVNFANGNAAIILAAMGMEYSEAELYGEADLATMKRGFIRARNTSRPEVLREHIEGGNYIQHGYTRDDLMRAIGDLEAMVDRGRARGATKVTWG